MDRFKNTIEVLFYVYFIATIMRAMFDKKYTNKMLIKHVSIGFCISGFIMAVATIIQR